jgi:uncharacterized repeat protein (TIGR03803 family)
MNLHGFSALYGGPPNYADTNLDGAKPAGIALVGNQVYGTAWAGGIWGGGTLFRVSTEGASFTNLYFFNPFNGRDTNPNGNVIASGNMLYGTARDGGAVFMFDIDALVITNLHTFVRGFNSETNADGLDPTSGLALYGDTLYGTAPLGGPGGSGTVFSLKTDGSGFKVLHEFLPFSDVLVISGGYGVYTNIGGGRPYSGVIVSSNTIYGTTADGGAWGFGTVFSLGMDGSDFRDLHDFTGGSDGGFPQGSLVLAGNALFGTAWAGGTGNRGVVFSLSTKGNEFRTLHSFSLPNTNSDGAGPSAGLTLVGNELYGTTYYGGTMACGTVFAIQIDGTEFRNVLSFTGASDGSFPSGGLTLYDNALYGTTESGGPGSSGTVFRIPILPVLHLITDGPNLVFAWSTNFTTLRLHSTTNLITPAWTPISTLPVTIGGQHQLSLSVSNRQEYFRLSQ